MTDSVDGFRAEVLEAFPSSYPIGLQIVSHKCDECGQLNSDFSGHEWAAIPETVIERHYSGLPLFTPEALRYFLPAFMQAALANPHSNIAEFLMYILAPSGLHADELSKFSVRQRGIVVSFLDLMAANDGYVRDKVWAKTRARWQHA